MTKVEIELPDETAEAAKNAGLLTSATLEKLLRAELRRQEAAEWLLDIAIRVEQPGEAPMSMEEITREVKAVRSERRSRADNP